MISPHVPVSDWDGQLPPHIARNEQIWWEVFPRIKPHLPPKLLRFLGAAKESPSREIIGKVVLVSATKGDLGASLGSASRGPLNDWGCSLLNDWGCYCLSRPDGLETVYMAGTATEPHLIFTDPAVAVSFAPLRFVVRVRQDMTDLVERIDQTVRDSLELRGVEAWMEESEVSIEKFKRGSWENGLAITFKAALWLNSDKEEALASIWNVKV